MSRHPDAAAPEGEDPRLALARRRLEDVQAELREVRDRLDLIESSTLWKFARRGAALFPPGTRRGQALRSWVKRLASIRGSHPGDQTTTAGPPAQNASAAQPVGRTRVMLVTPTPITDRMAGPGIRYWNFARLLAQECQVTLLVPNSDHPHGTGFAVRCHGGDAPLANSLMAEHDVLVFQGFALHQLPGLADTARYIVPDLVDPFNLEDLHSRAGDALDSRMRLSDFVVRVLNQQLQRGDFFICGNERQRDFWLGMLNANARLNPLTSDSDPTFRNLIDVVGFGMRPGLPRHSRSAVKGVIPGIGERDRLLLWNGGIWQWFDPLTLVRAMKTVSERRPDARLLFVGTASPDPGTPQMPIVEEAIELSRGLGLLDRSVFFSGWVDYDDFANHLLEADLGVSCHHAHLETRLSIRTRLFDYVWAGVPMVLTGGDELSLRLAEAGVARLVEPGDADALAGAILEELERGDARLALAPTFEKLRQELTWEQVARPLLEYCRQPHVAADRFLAVDRLLGGKAPAAR